MGLNNANCRVCGKPFVSYNPNPTYCSKSCKGMNLRHEVSLDKMVELYEQGLTQEEVAKELGTTQKVVFTRMKEIGYQPRVAAKRDQSGEKNDYWKGGKSRDSRGYVLVKSPGHPRAKKCGDYVFQHILVVEDFIGRFLQKNEIIHHINGIKDDNRLENLYITNPSEHSKMHNHGWAKSVKTNLKEYKVGVVNE
jgi:endogenous inhibitor of DNA gyrase (YacG/DUF329 family)